jgi:hypothetical protein
VDVVAFQSPESTQAVHVAYVRAMSDAAGRREAVFACRGTVMGMPGVVSSRVLNRANPMRPAQEANRPSSEEI